MNEVHTWCRAVNKEGARSHHRLVTERNKQLVIR